MGDQGERTVVLTQNGGLGPLSPEIFRNLTLKIVHFSASPAEHNPCSSYSITVCIILALKTTGRPAIKLCFEAYFISPWRSLCTRRQEGHE